MKESPHIRPVQERDLPHVLNLCALHAEYEKLPFHLHGQAARLRNDLFSQAPKLYGLVAEWKDEIIAYATYMKQYSTWEAGEYLYLDCLFVLENFRSHGLGELLINQVKDHAARLGYDHMQWQTPDFNERAIKFYRRIGAYSKSKERFFLTI